jgi:hypothetical protein
MTPQLKRHPDLIKHPSKSLKLSAPSPGKRFFITFSIIHAGADDLKSILNRSGVEAGWIANQVTWKGKECDI